MNSKLKQISPSCTKNMAVNAAARVWSPYKELYHVVSSAVIHKQPDAIQDLEVILRRHKPDFISLLKNPAPNPVHRAAVEKANVEGLPVQGRQVPQVLSEQFIQEALIISRLFELNEYAAVELLLAAENQQPYFPGLTRGLVAVLLYYDGKTSLVNALRALVQSREGRTWTMGLPDDLVSMATKFTDQLLAEGIINRILELLNTLDPVKEMTKLQDERALGHAKHRKQVADKIREVRLTLAECVLAVSCQSGLSREDTLRLLQHLRQCAVPTADATLDDVTLTLLVALLYAVDVRVLEHEDAEDIIQAQHVISDPGFLAAVHREMASEARWKIPQLQSVAQLAWAVSLRSLPQYHSPPGANEIYEQDESVADAALADGVFAFLRQAVISAPRFHQEKFFLMQIHNTITDFIVQMPLKVKELRTNGDEAARIIVANQQEGLEPPPNLPRHFEDLMLLIAELYGRDPLCLELALEYWCPPDTQQHAAGGPGRLASMYHRPSQRQVSLYKFLRMAGELLPPPLFVPYLHMIKGLATGPQCAHHCYNLLKNNGMGAHASPVSWDHFFVSINQYYTNLRQENAPVSDMLHVYRHHHLRGITPQELQGLMSVLELTETVAKHSEFARVALCESQQWLPLVVLLGLAGCSIPTVLKATILRTLAALAATQDIASTLWSAVESSQILPTVPNSGLHVRAAGSGAIGGIVVELDEVEARNEEYPLTLGFLQLLDALTDHSVPAGLGAGYRQPGFQPYLEFLRDFVLLRFHTRAYKDPAQKWEVAASVLGIMHKLLEQYEVVYEDFVEPGSSGEQGPESGPHGKPPGYSIMLYLLEETHTLKMILYIIDEASKLLDRYVEFPGDKHLKRAAMLCLELVRGALSRQTQFVAGLREAGASTLVAQLDKLLMGINPRSGKADHLVNVAKYVTYNAELPSHSLAAVHILHFVCQSPLVQPKIVQLLTSNSSLHEDILHGFVECIECDEPETQQPTLADILDEDPSDAQVRCQTRQQIVRLLLSALDHPAPNIAHFLLGFELRKPVAKSNLQDPGVMQSPRTCLHAVLSLLDKGADTRTGPSCLQDTPRVAELGYRLLYSMCANRDTSTPTLRYLRTSRDFLFRHLQHVPFQGHTDGACGRQGSQCWLLKAVAIELKLTAVNKQRSHTQRLVSLLLDDSPQLKGPDGVYEPELTAYENEFSLYTSQQNSTATGLAGTQARRKVLAILDSIQFSQEAGGRLELEYLNPSEVENLLTAVEERTEDGLVQGNVRLLMRLLMAEVGQQPQGALRQHQLAEVREICARLVERNTYREAIHIMKEAFESWRQVLEIILTACPSDLLSGEMRQNVLFEVLQDLLVKVAKEDVVPELSNRVAGVVLTLLANLRQCFLADQPEGLEIGHASQYVSLLDGTLPSSASQLTAFGGVSGGRTLYASSLQVVLRGLIEYLLRSSSGSQRVRANLYGALLCYLQIAQKPAALPGQAGLGVGARVTSGEAEYDKLSVENRATIASYGTTFMEVVCRDACDGHHVARMLSMAVLDRMLAGELRLSSLGIGGSGRGDWLGFVTGRGYLGHLVGSLLQDDEQLHAMLHPSPEPLRALYCFESKMGLLTRVAGSAPGAHMLLQCGLLARLAECSIFEMRPEGVGVGGSGMEDSFIPSVLTRYRKQVLFPALKLCSAVLTSLGSENKQAASKVLQFVVAHIDVFTAILREPQTPPLNVDSLRELVLTTALLARAAPHQDLDAAEGLLGGDTAAVEFRGHVMRLQRQLLALLPKFCLSPRILKQVRSGEGEDTEKRQQLQVLLVEVTANVTAFCRNLITNSNSGTSGLYRILFAPALDEALSRGGGGVGGASLDLGARDEWATIGGAGVAGHMQSLGLVVALLRNAADLFLATLDESKTTERKLERVQDLGAEELNELCGHEVANEKLPAQQRQERARRRLLHSSACSTQQLQLLAYIVENCLLLVWRHLEYYLLRCEPLQSGTSLFRLHQQRMQMRRLQESGSSASPLRPVALDDTMEDLPSGVSRQELDTLRQDAQHCLNDTLFKKIHEIEQCYVKQRSRFGYLEALVRRLQRLLNLHTST